MNTCRPSTLVLAGVFAINGIALQARAADAPVEKVTVKAVAHFPTGRATIAAADRDRILAEVGKMKGVSWQTVTATGYTDSTGSQTLNQKLSDQRARSVKTYLVGKGLDGKMIETAAKAEDSPVADNDTPSGRAKNRRTEITFEGVKTTAAAN